MSDQEDPLPPTTAAPPEGLDPEQLVGSTAVPLPRAPRRPAVTALLWGTRVFLTVLTALVVVVFIRSL